MILFIALMSLASVSFASLRVGTNSFAPENSMWISVDDKAAGGITEEEFNNVLDKAFDSYKPIADQYGVTVINTRDWEDGTVNSYASQSGKTWKVASFGGLARYKGMTSDAFALVACHELGHHFGGAPTYSRYGSTWTASEGQSDYYGTLKCMKHYLNGEDNVGYIANINVPATVSTKCNAVYSNSDDAAICVRSSLAGLVLAQLLNELGGGTTPVSFDTPDKKVVTATLYNSYPAVQCRLDSYVAGALCNKPADELTSATSVLAGSCNTSQGDVVGVRPLCWFKP